MTMAASPHVRDPHMRERGFLGYTKGGDSFGLTRGEFVPRPPSLPTPPPPAPFLRTVPTGQSPGGDVGWEEGWVRRITIQCREARGEVKGSDWTGKLSAFE